MLFRSLARTRIRNNVKLAEAPSFGRTIFEHAPDSNGARDYESFASELLAMLGVDDPAAKQKPAKSARKKDISAPESAVNPVADGAAPAAEAGA